MDAEASVRRRGMGSPELSPVDAAAHRRVVHTEAMFVKDRDTPDPIGLHATCGELATLAERTAVEGPWRSGAFAGLARRGVLAGFIPEEAGGTGAREPAILSAITAIAERCLTTALALTQWASAVRMLAGGPPELRASLLPPLARGEATTTVGISQLTTSRQHVGSPALVASAEADGSWRLDGLCPWVTGADSSDTIVTGAATAGGDQRFFVVRTDAPGLVIEHPLEMLALSGSRTSVVRFQAVCPLAVILPPAGGPRTGGLATTAVALGATQAALDVLRRESEQRPSLAPVTAHLATEAADLSAQLQAAAGAGIDAAARDRLRTDANSLVVRAAQAAITATKGAGFVRGHPVERLARESLFFLVWSCPQAVATATLCELAGLTAAT
jgi:alkylation response protein AidB-like acyl-CoA dehydrogenase